MIEIHEGEAPMFQGLDVFRMSSAMAKHAGERQALISQNVANADTPDYKARDLPEFKSVFMPEAGGAQRATRAGHLHGVSADGMVMSPEEIRDEASLNGNQVSLETEMLKSVSAQRDHDRALAIYKSSLSVLRTAIRS